MIKCYKCSRPLLNGKDYSLECKYCICMITFDKEGNPRSFVIEAKRGYTLVKYRDCKLKMMHYDKCILEADVNLTVEDGVLQVDKLVDRLRGLIVFS